MNFLNFLKRSQMAFDLFSEIGKCEEKKLKKWSSLKRSKMTFLTWSGTLPKLSTNFPIFFKIKNWFHGFRSDTKFWIFFPKTSSLKKPKTVVKSGELLLMRTQEFFEEIVVLKAHTTLYGFWKLLNFSQMTSGIPAETIVKFLWFRGIFDFLRFYTTLWSHRAGDPAKPKEQKKTTFEKKVEMSPKMKNRCQVSAGLCVMWKHLICA